MSSLGQELKRERELRAISLEDISDQTKISLRYLQALETDNLDILPGTFFIKGVLRAYARCLGINENDFVNKYHEEIILRDQVWEQERRREEFVPFPPKKRGPASFVLPLVGVLGLLAAGYIFVLRPGRTTTPEVPRPARQSPAPVTTTTVPETERSAADEDLRLELTFTSETWIQVIGDGEVQVDGLKSAGQKASCSARKEFLIRTGNAGGISYILNGRPGKPLGAPGEVKTNIRIDHGNLAEYIDVPGNPPDERPSR